MEDALLTFCTDQAVTASAAGGTVLPVGALRNIGGGRPLYGVVDLTEDMTDSGNDTTCTPKLQEDTADSFGSPTDCDVFETFAAVTAAPTSKRITIDPDRITEAFLRVYFTIAGNGNLTGGKFSAYITDVIAKQTAHPSGFSIVNP